MSGAASLARSLPPVYAAAALRVAFPLLVLPIMAARLGPEAFGELSLLLVWAALLSTVVEGGFLAAATREAVRADAAGRRTLARQVFSVRCLLSLAVLPLVGLVLAWVPQAGAGVHHALALALLACALGWPATWYLQASQQLHRWAWVELAIYALWLLATLVLAHSVAAYLWLNIAAALALALAGWAWLARDLHAAGQGGVLWRAAELKPGWRLGWRMLPVSIAGAAYAMALPAVASAQMERSQLGLYYLADRMVRAVLNAAEPMYQLVFPRIVAQFGQGARAALRYTARWAAAGAVLGSLMLGAAVGAWPLLRQGLPARVDAAALAPVMATLGLLLPLLLGWKFFGYWMLGSGRFDRAYRACVVAGGVFGVVAAWAFAAQGALALAGVAVAVELVVIAVAVAGMLLTRRAA
jgi:O-antigen/teichoic acid export membrane protein